MKKFAFLSLLTLAVIILIILSLHITRNGDDIKNNGISSSLLKCGDKEYNPESQFCDSRDNKIYKYVKINSKIWMAENLNYEAEGSVCYGNDPINCKKYGRLYLDIHVYFQNNICPENWHISTCDEWISFLNGRDEEKNYYCSSENIKDAGKKIKTKSGWNNGGNGTDNYGFAALPSGYGNIDGSFSDIGNYGGWWSLEMNHLAHDHIGWYIYYSDDYAYNASPYSNKYGGCEASAGGDCKMDKLPIRCIKNYICGEGFYDPSKEQKCCDNKIVYDGSENFCYKGKVHEKCGVVNGGDEYDIETEFCYEYGNGFFEVRKKQ